MASDQQTPYIGSFVLETLTLGMYGRSRDAIREYVQNSLDAIQEATEDGLLLPGEGCIEIELKPGESLVIRDNGAGLSESNAVAVLLAIGASNKDYRKNAGFRGIGRLAGIAFANRLSFITKARGETHESRVIIRADDLRRDLSPAADSSAGAAETLLQNVDVAALPAGDVDEHFFEVRLEGFEQAPEECYDSSKLEAFLSEVSPLPYRETFGSGPRILEKVAEAGIQVPQVRINLKTPLHPSPVMLTKRYSDRHVKGKAQARLDEVTFSVSPSHRWVAWVGRSDTSGAFSEPEVRGLRVRIRNIQIDGRDVMRDVFAGEAGEGRSRASHARLADWYVGEIFVKPDALIPNARRDGFEENQAWREIRQELDNLLAIPLGRAAYQVSSRSQLSADKINAQALKLRAQIDRVRDKHGPDSAVLRDQVTSAANVVLQRINRSLETADESDVEKLNALYRQVSEARDELRGVPVSGFASQAAIDAAKSQIIQRLYKVFRKKLGPAEFRAVVAIMVDVTGEGPA